MKSIKHGVVALGLLVLSVAVGALPNLTPEQLKMFQQLPPDQQAALVQQATGGAGGATGSAQSAAPAPQQYNNQTNIKPRGTGRGRLEKRPGMMPSQSTQPTSGYPMQQPTSGYPMQQPTSGYPMQQPNAAVQSTMPSTMGASPAVIPNGASMTDADRAARDAQNSSSTKLPLGQVDSQQAADKREARRSFEDFLRESTPMAVSTDDLEQFGYDLFAGDPVNFEPVADVPVPPEYVLGPGDQVKVQLFGKDSKDLLLEVDREGSVSFPSIGPITLAGLSFAQAKSVLSETIAKKMIGNTANITMGQLRSIRVFALGDVFRPGSYTVNGFATLSHALFSSGGIKKMGSLRNVQLKRGGQVIVALDLYDFLLRGDTSKDRRLLPGDVVFVPPIGRTVSVAGEVVRPAIYEIKNEKNIGDVLRLAGGLMPNAYIERALIERLDGKGEMKVVDVKLIGKGLLTPIQNGDVVKVFAGSDFETNQVLLLGNVKRPGTHAWEKGMRVSSVLKSMEDLLPESFTDYGIIEREAPGNREPMLVRFRLSEILSGARGSEADLALEARDKLYVFKRANFREQPRVTVAGSVQAPGDYEFKRNMHLADLVLAAGGMLRDTDTSVVEIYRTHPISKEVSLLRVNLAQAMQGNAQNDIELQDLDRVVMHSIYETKIQEQVTVMGEVHKPQTYPLGKGMRVSDLITAGGSVTEFAYLNKAEITRYTVQNGERRISDHFEVDLAAALKGDKAANVALQPYDVLTVRRLSNWRPAEQVEVVGEVLHPGLYPVEEGERLSALLERVGGFTNQAYLPALVLTRESVRLEQQKQIDELARRMEGELAALETKNATTDDASLKMQRQRGLESGQKLLAQLKSTQATGRVIINVESLERLKGSESDVRLRTGDKLVAPKRPDEIMVLGEVYSQSAMLFSEQYNRDDYVNQAGPTRMADTDATYVVHVNGQVDTGTGGGFFSSKGKLGPGDAVIVPPDLRHVDMLDIALDWSRAMMQIGTTIAAGKAIGVFK